MSLSFSVDQLNTCVREAGKFALQEFNNFSKSAIEYKGRNDMVSYVDKETEKILVDQLLKLFPEAGFLTEEKTVVNDASTPYRWIIDPIDGTTNFVHGIPYFAVSVGLLHEQQLLMGTVYHPPLDECYSAELGKGAFCNGQPLKTSGVTRVDESLVVVGFPYGSQDHFAKHFGVLETLAKGSHGFRRLGAAALDLAYVAAGKFDAFFEQGLKPWDLAAGVLLVREANGMVTDFSAKDEVVFGKEIVACAPNIHQELLEHLRALS